MEHTPIPWEVMEDWTEDHSRQQKIVARESLTIIGRLDPWNGSAADEQKANAAYIVQAVNHHEEMVAALQDLCTLWTNWAKDSQFLTEPLRRSLHMRVDEAGAILQRIEKE